MRTLLLVLICHATLAQSIDPALIYSIHTRLGMNGRIKHVTTYKYTNLKQKKGNEITGTLYSVIKNSYDSVGYIIHDSTAIFYNPKSAYGYCKDYKYHTEENKHIIQITTRFDCMPPYDNKAIVPTVIELTTPDDSTILAREYNGTELLQKRGKLVSSYRFTLGNNLIQRTVFEAYKKRIRHAGSSTYLYDEYNNFKQTTLKIGATPKQVIQHKISNIDGYGNALRMLNYINNNPEPEFMTVYQFEYYK